MRKLLFIIIFLFVSLASCYSNPLIYYQLDLSYDASNEDILEVKSIKIKLLDEDKLYWGGYSVKIVGYERDIINMINFSLPTRSLYDNINNNGEIISGGFEELNKTEFELFVPYYEKAKEIVIYDSDMNELIREDVSMFSKNINKEIETEDKMIEKKEYVSDEKSFIKYWWVLIVVVIILIGAVIYFYLRRRK